MADGFENLDLYNVVDEPARYDAFMRTLLKKIEGLADKKDSTQTGVLDTQWDKASQLVTRVTPWKTTKKSDLDKFLASRMQAVMAADETGAIISANYAARGLYNLQRDATLRDLPMSGKHHSTLRNDVSNLIEGQSLHNTPNNVLRLQNSQTKTPLLLTLTKRVDDTTDRALAVITTNELHWPLHLGLILVDLFDLTQAEIEVTRLMVLGYSVNEMTKKRATSISTIRSQLRSVFAKTDTTSQLEYLRMVFGLAMMHDPDEGELVASRIQANTESTSYPRYHQRHIFHLKNGRQIDYSVFGAKMGPKLKGHILFYHDQALGDTWFKDTVIAASRAGLQIIAPLRPGFGRTSLYEGEASDPLDFAPEIKMLLDHLEVKTAAILTQRSGLVHALAAAQLMPDRFTSITAANPILPVTCDADIEGTNGYNRLLPKTRLHFPQALRFLCKAGFAFVTTKGPAVFVKAVVRDSPKDLEWVSRADIMLSILPGRLIHGEHGYLGTYGDIAYADDWTYLLTDSPIPIRMVIGEHDMNVQWAAARRWARELNHAELHVVPDSGYFVQHQQPGQFLDWFKQDLRLK